MLDKKITHENIEFFSNIVEIIVSIVLLVLFINSKMMSQPFIKIAFIVALGINIAWSVIKLIKKLIKVKKGNI